MPAGTAPCSRSSAWMSSPLPPPPPPGLTAAAADGNLGNAGASATGVAAPDGATAALGDTGVASPPSTAKASVMAAAASGGGAACAVAVVAASCASTSARSDIIARRRLLLRGGAWGDASVASPTLTCTSAGATAMAGTAASAAALPRTPRPSMTSAKVPLACTRPASRTTTASDAGTNWSWCDAKTSVRPRSSPRIAWRKMCAATCASTAARTSSRRTMGQRE